MVIHLEGMGLLGCLLACKLHQYGVPFTWHDSDEEVTAWKACTGACYPSSNPMDFNSWMTWRQWAKSPVFPRGCLEQCRYWVDSNHTTLPHGWDGDVEDIQAGMRLVGYSVHCNAQRLVGLVREQFREARRDAWSRAGTLVVAHGFSKLCQRYLWGWSRLVRLDLPEGISRHGRPSFYLRRNRFQFAYCYPQPGTDLWYAGSSLVSQQTPRKLTVEPRYDSWLKWFQELSGGAVGVTSAGPILQGWRPSLASGLSDREGYQSGSRELLTVEGNVVYLPVLASNGFRIFPEVWKQLSDGCAVR